ncbi:MAG: L-threonylcarbamoyladenylate synthase [Spongiibacteraceae bacterium]
MSSIHVRQAVQALRRGGVIAYPTEGVWGLGCNPFDPDAVAKVLELKQREVSKGLILIAATIEQCESFLRAATPAQRSALERSWPGPQTWVVPHGGTLPDWVTGFKSTVALRVSAHPLVAALCRAYGGPIVSTSANPSGREPARNSLQVRHYFSDRLDYILPGKLGGQLGPTPIRDLVSGQLLRGV